MPRTPKIEETTQVKVYAPSPDGTLALQTITVAADADPTREYVGASSWFQALGYARALPQAIDELERDFGTGNGQGVSIYSQMMVEPIVQSSVEFLIQSALAREIKFVPARKPHEDGYEDARKIADFCKRNIDYTARSFGDVHYELMQGAFTHGHKVGEVLYEPRSTPEKADAWCLLDIKPRPQRNTGFMVDGYNNLLGVFYVGPDQWLPPHDMILTPGMDLSFLIPAQKLVIPAWSPQNADPRGTSGLRPIYHAWWMLQQIYESLKKYLAIYATPPLHIVMPEKAQPQKVDAAGATLPTPIPAPTVYLNAAKALRAAGIMVSEYGTTADLLQVAGDGMVYERAITAQQHRIVQAILWQTMATMEPLHSARGSAGGTGQDVMGIRTNQIKTWSEETVQRQIVWPLVRRNWGERYVELAPRVSLGETETKDLPAMLTAIATAYNSGFIEEDQKPDIYEDVGLPDSELLDERIRQMIVAAQNGDLGALPVPGGPPGNPGNGQPGGEVAPGGSAVPNPSVTRQPGPRFRPNLPPNGTAPNPGQVQRQAAQATIARR